MATIIVVDDDLATDILVENLCYLGHSAKRLSSADSAFAALDEILDADLLVLDIIMSRTTNTPGPSISGCRTTGMAIFQVVRAKRPTLQIVAYTASSDPDVLDVLKQDAHTTFIAKWSAPSLKDLIARIQNILGIAADRQHPQIFIVHGHDEATKWELKNYLQNTLGLPEPIILHEQVNQGRTLMEKFEHYALKAYVAMVLLTPDDSPADVGSGNEEKRRARQNVIFEMGYFLGALGRSSGRVLLLYKGTLELPSDITGVTYINITGGIQAAGELIRRELNSVLGE